MKQIGFILLVLLCSNLIVAQDNSEEIHTYQVTFNSSTNVLLSSRVEFNRRLSQKGYYFNIGVNLYGSNSYQEPKISSQYPTTRINVFFLTSLGIHRLNHNHEKKLSFLKGANILIYPQISYLKVDNPALPRKMQRSIFLETSWGISFKYGIYYNFSNNFAIGSQIEPFIIFHKSESHDQTSYNFEYRTFSNYSFISLKYSW